MYEIQNSNDIKLQEKGEVSNVEQDQTLGKKKMPSDPSSTNQSNTKIPMPNNQFLRYYKSKYSSCYRFWHILIGLVLKFFLCVLDIFSSSETLHMERTGDSLLDENSKSAISWTLIVLWVVYFFLEIFLDSYFHSKFYQGLWSYTTLAMIKKNLKYCQPIFTGFSVVGDMRVVTGRECCTNNCCKCCDQCCCECCDKCCCLTTGSFVMRNCCLFNRCLFFCCANKESPVKPYDETQIGSCCFMEEVGPNAKNCCCNCYFYESHEEYATDFFNPKFGEAALEELYSFEREFQESYNENSKKRICCHGIFECIGKAVASTFSCVFNGMKFGPIIMAVLLAADNIQDVIDKSNRFHIDNRGLTLALAIVSIIAVGLMAVFSIIPEFCNCKCVECDKCDCICKCCECDKCDCICKCCEFTNCRLDPVLMETLETYLQKPEPNPNNQENN